MVSSRGYRLIVLFVSLIALCPARVGSAQEANPPSDTAQVEKKPANEPTSDQPSKPDKPADGTGTEQKDQEPANGKPTEETKAEAQKPSTDNAAPKNETAADSADKKQSESKPADNNPAKEATDKAAPHPDQKKEEKKKTGIRHLALSGDYVDMVQPMGIDPFSLALGEIPIRQKSFYRLCEYLSELGKATDVQHIVFDLSDDVLGMDEAQLDELERRMTALTATGKKTYAWLENASAVHLAIAAFCDEVIMADFGGIDFPSVALQSMYYRDAMDLIGMQASVVRAGDYKGAVEPYTTASMSEHLKRHYLDLLDSMNSARVSRVAKGRGLTTAAVRDIQKQRFLTPSDAQSHGLVDRLAPFGGMKKAIDDLVGEPSEWSTPTQKKKREMSFFEFMSAIMAGPKSSTSRTKDNTIAVFHLNGIILDGKTRSPGAIVSGPTVKDIQALIDDEKIKGVVLRINSPGGSATASESVRQALKKLVEAKPTVISMGRVAASGGYWLSSIGVPVYAERATITGSIGVFSMKLSFGPLMRRVGVHLESIALDDSATAFSIDRPWSEADVSTLSKTIDLVYGRFLDLVCQSRRLPMDKLKSIAGGKIWSGSQAKELGLIDEIGGVDECLAAVAKKAKLDNYPVIHRPTRSAGISLFELLGESDEDEVFDHASFMPLKLLAQRGFQLEATKALIRDALQRTQGLPNAWLLNEAELSIR